jgi:branched-chain amino acid transport system ATP-binding protein
MADRLLEVRALDAHYGEFQVLFGISLHVSEGEVVALTGANGAGKSTLLKCIAGMIPVRHNAISFYGVAIGGGPSHEAATRGIALVPEGRRLFASLTVEENLLIGGQLGRKGPWTLKRIYELFPLLEERRHQLALSLSAGEQQMAATGRALMANPRLLLCDEAALAPADIRTIAAAGVSLMVVEQDIVQMQKIAGRVYCLRNGRIALQGEPEALTRERISAAYFGV